MAKTRIPKEYPTGGDVGGGEEVAEIDVPTGAAVQVLDITAQDSDAPDPLSGLHGTVAGRDPFGGYLVKIGAKTVHLARENFTVTAATAMAPEAFGQQHTPPAVGEEATAAHRINLVEAAPVSAINSPTNPRRRRGLDMDSLRALADSLTAHGLMQPIIVRPLPGARLIDTASMHPRPVYEIIAGERRWRAAQLAELPTMPMLVRQLSDEAVLELQLVENIEREDLDAMEEAEGFALLRDKLGYTVDQIAERIGKGKGASYVRKTMKLLDLTPESREAMYEGILGRSTGLLVARYPAERQADVVKYIKSQAGGPKGTEPAPFRAVATALYSRFNTTLAGAAFDTEDAALLPEAGKCSECPKRTGYHQDLFGDAAQTTADSCTDAACYARKKEAHVVIVRQQAEADGCEVIEGEEARKAKPSPHSSWLNGYTPITSTAFTDVGSDGKEREVTFEDALRAQGRNAPKPAVFIDPHTSAAVKVIPNALADSLMPPVPGTGGQTTADQPTHPAAAQDQRTPEQRALASIDVMRALLLRAFDAIRTTPRTTEELRLVAYAAWESDLELTELYLGWSDELADADAADAEALRREKIDAMDADQLAQAITMAALEYEVTTNLPRPCSGAANTRAMDAIALYHLDILAVQAKVQEDLARQQADETD